MSNEVKRYTITGTYSSGIPPMGEYVLASAYDSLREERDGLREALKFAYKVIGAIPHPHFGDNEAIGRVTDWYQSTEALLAAKERS